MRVYNIFSNATLVIVLAKYESNRSCSLGFNFFSNFLCRYSTKLGTARCTSIRLRFTPEEEEVDDDDDDDDDEEDEEDELILLIAAVVSALVGD